MRRLFFVFSFFATLVTQGQNTLFSNDLNTLCEIGNHTFIYNKEVARENKNPVQFLFSALYLTYKNFFSSQDFGQCAFHPSCSEYALLSIKRYGFFVAVMDASDRLLRCNHQNNELYEYDENKNLMIDYP